MSERLLGIFRKKGAEFSRHCADRSNTSCLSASLAEAGAELGTGRPVLNVKRFGREIGETERGTTPPFDLLGVVQRGSRKLGMKVDGVLVNPSFLEHCEVPEGMEDKIEQVTGKHTVQKPHVRILAKKAEGTWHTHAETDTDSSRRRIEEMENDGWISAMVIRLRKRG